MSDIPSGTTLKTKGAADAVRSNFTKIAREMIVAVQGQRQR